MCRSRGTSWLGVGGLKSMETGMGSRQRHYIHILKLTEN